MRSEPRRGLLVILSGPAGVGKTTVRNRLLEDERFVFSVSATTRPPRDGETDGVDYHFLAEDEFRQRIDAGEFLEHATVHGNRYGTLRGPVEQAIEEGRVPLLDIDVQGADSVRALDMPAVYVFILPPTIEELRRRMESRRSETPASLERRLQRAREEMERAGEYDLAVVNEDLETCIETVRAFVMERLEG